MEVVDDKGYMNYYNLTHQTCSVKSDNCIFVVGKFSKCKDWSSIPCKHIFTSICVQYTKEMRR